MFTRPSDVSVAFTTAEKLLFGIGAVLCYGIWHALTTWLGLPAYARVSGSLMTQPVIGWVLVIVGIPVISVLISLLVGRVRCEAGLFCCAIGLITLPSHGGDIRNVLLDTGSAAIYTSLAIESAVLGVVWIGTSWIVDRLAGSGIVAEPVPTDDPDTLGDCLTAVALQALATLVLLMLLCQSPLKGQTLASVCLASLIASTFIHQSYVVRGSVWYIAGTMLAGVIAYLYTGMFNPAGYLIGDVRGLLAGAARPLPLHYATMGVAGAIFGYWTSVVWHAAKKAKAIEAEAA